MLEDLVTDITLTAHQEIKKSKKVCNVCLTLEVLLLSVNTSSDVAFTGVTKVSTFTPGPSPKQLIQDRSVHVPLSARAASHSRATSPAPIELTRSNSNNALSGTATPIPNTKPEGNLYFECLNCDRSVKRREQIPQPC
jgi:hypothetical protein